MKNSDELVRLQETLYESKNPTRRWLHNSRKNWIVSKILFYAGPKANISLEIGPGSGIYIPSMQKVSEKLIVTDLRKEYLAHVSAKYENTKICIMEDDITKSKLPSRSVDLILFTEVIEHIEDPLCALRNIHRILKPGGILILSTPQKYSMLEMFSKLAFLPVFLPLVRLVYREPILETGHINLTTEKTLKKQIENTGFKIVEQHKSGLYIPLISEFFRDRGLALEQRLEKKIAKSRLDFLLWTQYYILKKKSRNSAKLVFDFLRRSVIDEEQLWMKSQYR